MRERIARLSMWGPNTLYVQIVERNWGDPAWRVVEEFDVTPQLHALTAGMPPLPVEEREPPLPEEPAREPVGARNGNDQ